MTGLWDAIQQRKLKRLSGNDLITYTEMGAGVKINLREGAYICDIFKD